MDCNLPCTSFHGDSPSNNTGVGSHALLQGIFSTQRSNPGLPLKKEFIGPGLHLRPVHAQPPFQWTLNSVFSAYENSNRRIRPPQDGNLEDRIYVTHHLRKKHTLITPSSRQAISFSVSIGV